MQYSMPTEYKLREMRHRQKLLGGSLSDDIDKSCVVKYDARENSYRILICSGSVCSQLVVRTTSVPVEKLWQRL